MEFGTISENGTYVAPSKMPTPNEIRIRAQMTGTTVPYAWATVIIGPQPPRYSLVGFWDKKGEGREELIEVHEIEIEPSGNLLIVDPILSRVFRFTPDGTYLGDIGQGKDKKPGGFDGPRDAKADPSGEIYVVDGNKCQVLVFEPNGNLLRCWGRKGSGPGDMLRPHSIALGPDDLVYIVDVDNSRASVYDRAGRHVLSWGRRGTGAGEFIAPHGIANDPNGDIFVVEYDGRCQKFTPQGEFLCAFANPCEGEKKSHGYYRYHAMASDDWGNVYLMARDTRNDHAVSIDKYNNNGDFVTRFSLPPEENRKMGGQGAAIAPSGRIYVADTESGHAGVSIFDPL